MIWKSRLVLEIAGLLCATSIVAILAFLSISSEPPHGDALSYARMGYHIAVNGVASTDTVNSDPTPAMRRSPGYPAFIALHFGLFKPDPVPSLACILKGEPQCADALRLLKSANATIIVLLSLTAYVVARIWFASIPLGFAAFGLVALNTSFSGKVDIPVSEPLAALLLLLTSALTTSALCFDRYRKLSAVGAGVAFGCLMLTRAIFFYLGPILFIAGLVFSKKGERLNSLVPLLIFLSIAYAIAGLWIWRNYNEFGQPSIASQRRVMAIRAEYLFMTWKEYMLAYLAFTPGPGQTILKRYFPEESYEKLLRTNPDGYYKRAKGNSGEVAASTGVAKPTVQELNRTAKQLILQRWKKNLALVPLFAYRGSLFEASYGYTIIAKSAPPLAKVLRILSIPLLLSLVPVMIIMTGISLYRWDVAWLIFLTPCLSNFALLAAVTHFIPRYSQPMIPCLLIALIGLIHLIINSKAKPVGQSP